MMVCDRSERTSSRGIVETWDGFCRKLINSFNRSQLMFSSSKNVQKFLILDTLYLICVILAIYGRLKWCLTWKVMPKVNAIKLLACMHVPINCTKSSIYQCVFKHRRKSNVLWRYFLPLVGFIKTSIFKLLGWKLTFNFLL